MLPSEFAQLDANKQRDVRNAIRAQGSKSSTPVELIRSLHRLRKEINPSHQAQIVDYWMDDTQAPKLNIMSEVRSLSSDGKWHQEVVFLNPNIQASHAPRMLQLPVKDKSGRVVPGEVWFMPPMSVNTPIKVRCSCPDFQHTFSWEDYDVNSLKGRRIQYLSSGNRPPRNPDHHPGICKHIGALLYLLQSSTDVMEKSPRLRDRSMFI